MEVQAALGSDIALVFDECTPFHADRDYTARSTERTHRWLDRCIAWHDAARARRSDPVYGIVQGGVYEDLRARRRAGGRAARARPAGSRSAARSARTRRRCSRSSAGRLDELPEGAPDKPRHLLGIGEVDDLVRGVELGIDTFDCAMPTRIGRHGMALVPDPSRRWRDRPHQGPAGSTSTSRSCEAAPARRAARASPAPTCTTSSAPTSRRRCGSSRSTTSPSSSG